MSTANKIKLPDQSTVDLHDVRITGVDSTPTANSGNIVTSNGVFEAIENKADFINRRINDMQPIPSVFTSGNLADFNSNGNTVDSGIAASDVQVSIVETTYSELKNLRDGSQLRAGQKYRITDYQCTTVQEDTHSAGHQFDIIVTALSENTLSEEASAIQHEGDTYFTNNNLSAWKLWYCLNNDTDTFAWADSGSTGRGVIYRMIDEWDNDVPYDFKNIQFKRKLTDGDYDSAGTETWVYTFNAYYEEDEQNYDGSTLTGSDSLDDYTNVCMNNTIYRCVNISGFPLKIQLNNIVFLNRFNSSDYYFECIFNTFKKGCYDNTFGRSCSYNIFGPECSNNILGGWCRSNTFGDNCWSNTFGDSCTRNTFGGDCRNNTFGDHCDSNSFGSSCSYNTFGNNCHDNTFGDSCSNNTFGDNCSRNIFVGGCYNNTFSNECYSNSLGSSCQVNTFGNYCSSNTFGNNCSYNTFGSFCRYNTFGDACSNNTFGDNCSRNTFGTICEYIKFGSLNNVKSYYRCIIVENGNQCIYLNCTGTTSNSNYYQNVTIAQGVNNTGVYKTITDSNVGQTYKTTYQPANSQMISV